MGYIIVILLLDNILSIYKYINQQILQLIVIWENRVAGNSEQDKKILDNWILNKKIKSSNKNMLDVSFFH